MSITYSYQPAFSSGELSPQLQGRIDWEKYDAGAKLLQNMVVRKEGGATKVPGTQFLADTGIDGERAENARPVRLIPFSFNVDQSYVLEISDRRMRVLNTDGLVLGSDGQPFTLELPYLEADIHGISHAQSADVMYMAHGSYSPRKLMRYGHADWRMEALTFLPKTAAPGGVSAAFSIDPVGKSTRVWRYVVTAINGDSGEESLPSAVAVVTGTESMRVGVLLDGEPQADWYATISWTAVAGADEYRVYKETSEGSGMYGYIGSATGTTFSDRNIAVNAEDTPPVGHHPFENGNNPSCVGIFQQRLAFASSTSQPSTFWMSRTGSYENFTKSMRVKADDYIEATLDSPRVNPVVWMANIRTLVLGTTGEELELRGTSNSGALAPGQVKAPKQSSWGSARNIPPVIIGNSLLHVTRNGDSIRDLSYAYNKDAYGGSERSLFATHLFNGRSVVDMSYQETPYSVIWCVMDDGALMGLTWLEEQNIYAWHRHVTDGFYEAVCTIPGKNGDETFFVVRRLINGVWKRYHEKLARPFYAPEKYPELSDKEQQGVLSQAFFVHSGLSYEGPPIAEISGLDHLEGKTVTVLQDGAVHPPLVVQGGRVTLRAPASVTQSLELLGYQYGAIGYKEVFKNLPRARQLAMEVREQSPFMASRMENYNRDLRDFHKTINSAGPLSWVNKLQNVSFIPMGLVQFYTVDLPTWIGAREKGLADFNGDEAKARAYADSIVRRAQGSGSTKDLARVQRTDPLFRMFTMFYSYFSTLYGLGARRTSALKHDHSPMSVFLAANSFLLLVAAPAVLSELVAGRGPDDDDDKTTWALTTILEYPFLSVVLLRDMVSPIFSGYSYELSPVSAVPRSVVNWFNAVQKALEEESLEPLIKPTILAGGYIVGLPVQQAIISAGNMWDFLTGEDPEFYLRDLFFVKPESRR